VTDRSLRSHPEADPRAPAPRIGVHRVNGTTLYAEVRGAGPAVLIVPGGAADAEGWRPVAERITGRTVVTYDRRGTLRSGTDDWPGAGSAQHADDAAGLLRALGLRDVVVFGGSSGGIVAVQLALRHPALVGRALVYEPGYLRCVPGGEVLQRGVRAAIEAHLARHPSDWVGAYAAFARGQASAPGGLIAPADSDWYARREELNAEAFIRDDVAILTTELPDDGALASLAVEVRFAHGTSSPAVFRDIATHLAAVRADRPDVIEGAGHALYLQPDAAAAYIHRRSG
jgi:pimeloyl-ACP methyl ester carboxylesterase